MEIPLRDALGRASLTVWPRCSQRELLLDLGERKRWGADDLQDALERVARHLHAEHGMTESIVARDAPRARDDPKALRTLGEALAGESEVGVARWLCGLAPALGVSPKTLANGVGALRDRRPEHRWIRAIARCLRGERRRDAWAYHLRTSAAVARSLALRDAAPLLATGDVADLRFRIDRMRAYREGRTQLAAEGAPVRSDYARASLALERRRRGEPAGAGPFDPSAPGLMMLLPLLRSRGLLVNHEP